MRASWQTVPTTRVNAMLPLPTWEHTLSPRPQRTRSDRRPTLEPPRDEDALFEAADPEAHGTRLRWPSCGNPGPHRHPERYSALSIPVTAVVGQICLRKREDSRSPNLSNGALSSHQSKLVRLFDAQHTFEQMTAPANKVIGFFIKSGYKNYRITWRSLCPLL